MREKISISSISLIIILAILFLINIITDNFDYKIDLTENKLFTLSNESKEILKNTKEEINIYALVATGIELEILDEYPKFSSNISVTYKDPNYFPAFVDQFKVNDNTILPGSLIIKSDKRQKIIDPSLLLTESTTNIEFEVTNAIKYVSEDNVDQKIYYVFDHGEYEMPQSYKDILAKNGFEFEEISLSITKDLPEDISCLIISMPTIDYSKSEVEILKKYFDNGGNALILFEAEINKFPNMNELCTYIGFEIAEHYVYEGDSNYSLTQDHLGFYTSPTDHPIMLDLLNRLQVGPVVLYSFPISILNRNDENQTVSSLLVSSEKSYIKLNNEAQTFEKEAGDIEGPFSLAVIFEKTNNDFINNDKGKIIVLSSLVFLSEEFSAQYTEDRNAVYLLQFIANLGKSFNYTYVPKKSVLVNNNFILTENEVKTIQSLTLILIPLIIILLGVLVWYRRKNK